MQINRMIVKDTYYVGHSDRRIALFENTYPLTNGVSYNSYVILDEKTCLMDGVDESIVDVFLDKLNSVLGTRKLDYFVIQHMEPDHAGSIRRILELHPDCTVVLNDKSYQMFKNFNEGLEIKNLLLVKEFDSLVLGKHTLKFVFAPMVHWPEVMVTYDTYTKSLFSADAFGTFGALNSDLFTNRDKFEKEFLDEARRYYTNIVGKYGVQVQALLKKAQTIEIENLLPLHGPIWKEDLGYILDLYNKWSSYTPEVEGALIVYGSVYGHSAEAANMIADMLAEKGLENIKIYDSSKTDKSYLVSETFKYSHLIICASTYNMGIFTPTEEFLLDLKYHNIQNRKFAVVENGSWAPVSGKLVIDILSSFKGFAQIGNKVTFKSSVKKDDFNKISELADLIFASFSEKKVNNNPLFNIGYGLYALSTSDGTKQNSCIINSVNQVASSPDKIMLSVNKNNYTAETLKATKKCNLNILTTETPFSIFERFGFQSGRTVNKFDGFNAYEIAKNGVNRLTKFINSYISLNVVEVIDLGSHYGFICEIEDSVMISNKESLTYDFYFKYIKPAPKKVEKKTGWVCKICGYVYEGEELPKDFICPICKHGAEDFERIK